MTVHEFGHFWVARRCGVKVLRFSVGFGKPLWRYVSNSDQTEYVIAAIPLGGYVKMLDERDQDVSRGDRCHAFNTQTVGKRMAIVAAGPLANFLLAILIYWLMYTMGISGVTPIMGKPKPDSVVLRAGFMAEDRLVSVDDTRVNSWSDVRIALLDSDLGQSDDVVVVVETQQGFRQTRHISEDFSAILQQDGDILQNIGMVYWSPEIAPVIESVDAGSPAAQAGLIGGDRILSLNGQAINDWRELSGKVRALPNQSITLQIEREGRVIDVSLVTSVQQDGTGLIGVRPYIDPHLGEKVYTITRYGVLQGLWAAVKNTWKTSIVTVKMLLKLVVGQASLKNISGPVTIAHYAGVSASIGIDHYLAFIALISISIAILNLLPIPVLDGGHLLYLAFEWIKGSPLTETTQAIGQQIGILLLGGLMLLAVYNDIVHLML